MDLEVIHFVRDLEVASGGPSRSVPALAESQAQLPGVGVRVCYRDRNRPQVTMAPGRVEYRPQRGHSIDPGSRDELQRKSVFHLHGLWSPGLHRAASIARAWRIPYVVSTRGMLAPWAMGHRAMRKRVAWKLYQQRDLRLAACLVASSEIEQRDVQAMMPGSRVVVLPNGCEPRPVSVLPDRSLPGVAGIRWALAIGRLHPVKGYAELIQAWARVRPPGWRLAIAGPDESGYRATLEALVQQHGLDEEILFLGVVDDARKWALLDRCELFLAPSRTENFGMAIAEALQSGRPVITTTGTPWRELAERDCGWWVDGSEVSLRSALAHATALDPEVLAGKGIRGQAFVLERFGWDRIAARSIELYQCIARSPDR